jgi:hypothetical protein
MVASGLMPAGAYWNYLIHFNTIINNLNIIYIYIINIFIYYAKDYRL